RARRLRREQWWARRHGARRRPGDVVAAVPRPRNEPEDVARNAVLVDVSAERVAEDLVVAGIEDLARAGVVRGRVGVHGPAEVRDGVPGNAVAVRAEELEPLVGETRRIVDRAVAERAPAGRALVVQPVVDVRRHEAAITDVQVLDRDARRAHDLDHLAVAAARSDEGRRLPRDG